MLNKICLIYFLCIIFMLSLSYRAYDDDVQKPSKNANQAWVERFKTDDEYADHEVIGDYVLITAQDVRYMYGSSSYVVDSSIYIVKNGCLLERVTINYGRGIKKEDILLVKAKHLLKGHEILKRIKKNINKIRENNEPN